MAFPSSFFFLLSLCCLLAYSLPRIQAQPSLPVSWIISEELYNSMFLHKDDSACPAKGFYPHSSFIEAARKFPKFGTTGNLEKRKREIAAFFGQISHETTGGWPTAPDGPLAWGLCFKEEISPRSAYCDSSNSSDTNWPCYRNKTYLGRGPIQLSWMSLWEAAINLPAADTQNQRIAGVVPPNFLGFVRVVWLITTVNLKTKIYTCTPNLCWNFNYGPAGHALGFDGLKTPEIVANEANAFKTALWFWMMPRQPVTSCHDIMVGRFRPSKADRVANRTAGFGLVTNIVNGGLGCGIANDGRVHDRIGFFKRDAQMHVVPNLDCDNQKPF